MDLIDELQRRRGDKTQQEFADELGIAQTYLSELIRRDKCVGIEVARRIVRVYPDLEEAVKNYLLGRDAPEGAAASK